MNLNDPNLQQSSFGGSEGSATNDDAVMPLGVGDDLTPDGGLEFGGTGEQRKINSSAILLVVVVAVAIGGLFSMRTLTRATAADHEPSEIEQTIEMFLKVVSGDAPGSSSGIGSSLFEDFSQDQTLLNILDDSYTARQVSLTNVQRNPFIIFEESRRKDDSKPADPEVDPREALRAEKKTLFRQAGERIEVRSILMGSSPLANIDNRIVGVGDTVRVEPEEVSFRVERIDADSVSLVAEDRNLDVRVPVTVIMQRENTRSPNRGGGRRPGNRFRR